MIAGIGSYYYTLRKLTERHTGHSIRIECHGLTIVTTLADNLYNRNLSKQRNL